jgi:vacuolar-type H+-ATPase subunit H
MTEQGIIDLVSRTAALMEQYERASSGIQQQLASLTKAAQESTRQLPAAARQSADGLLSSLPSHVMQQVQKGLDQSTFQAHQRLEAVAAQTAQRVEQLGRQIQQFQHVSRMLIWKIVGITAISLACLLVGGIWLANHYYTVIRDNQIDATLMQAYNRADVTLCHGQLCANVDTKGARYGNDKQYLIVKPR